MQVMTSDMYTVNVIGCGRVGKTLAALIHQVGAGHIQDLYSRSPSSAYAAAEFIGAGKAVDSMESMRMADIWLIAVPDSQIAGVASALSVASDKISSPLLERPIAFHCSGFESSSLLEPLGSKGFGVASLHPVLSFADPGLSVNIFEGTPCGIEGEPDNIKILSRLVEQLKGKPFELSAQHKRLYHAAAVISSNLNVVLQAMAVEAWQASGVPSEIIPFIHASLLHGTTQNVLTMGPVKALTGPAARGDQRVVDLQQVMLSQWHAEAGQAYALLSNMASRLAQSGHCFASNLTHNDKS